MLKVVLTGGIGCGKSTAVDAFRVLGVPIIDADKISKDIVKAGSGTLVEIAKLFGDDILLEDGELNRQRLKDKVFTDSKALEKLELILHPAIRVEITSQILKIENNPDRYNSPPYLIADIPLLVEKNYQALFDRVIVVDCLPDQQLERVIKRDGMTVERIKKIMNVQADREERLKSATDILDNTGDADTLRAQVKILDKKFRSSNSV